jgi:hypothetical protein
MLKKILLGLVGLTTMTGCVVVAPRPPVAAYYYGPEVVAPVPAPVVVAPVPVFGFWGGGYYHGGGYYGRGHWR